ncbi:MAG: T9SS type A sorting domain-containing protein [Bacteroidetes bacterium]|nr:T9SS type A sorting domain-containing protein [Bacteroidota bacterium]
MKTTRIIILVLALLILSFKIGDIKSEYTLPAYGRILCSADFNLDGDIDIASGHNFFWQTEWSGISILDNDSSGYYSFLDSLYIYGGQINIYSTNVLGNEQNEIIGQYYDGQQSNAAIVEINNGNYEFTYYPLCDNLTHFNIGDVNGDSYIDIIFISNNDLLWGIIYNDGTGNFSTPENYDLGYPPLDIACADLNNDGRDDVVITDYIIEVYFSYEIGFEQQLLGYTLPWSSNNTLMISDFDHDNDPDVILSATSNSNHSNVYMIENLGNNQFLEHDYFQFTPFCSYAQIADFNNDTLPDIVFTAYDYTGLYIYHNKGDFQLEYNQYIFINNSSSRGLNCNDFDNNGYKDIAIIKDGIPQSTLQLLFNDGQGNFVDNPITEIPNTKYQIPNFSAFPNPFTDNINFEIETNEKSNIILSIYDLQGNLVYESTKKYEKGGLQTITWDSKNMFNTPVGTGTYIVVVIKDGTIYKSVKLIKY